MIAAVLIHICTHWSCVKYLVGYFGIIDEGYCEDIDIDSNYILKE